MATDYVKIPSAPRYQISRDGRVIGAHGKKILKPSIHGGGYLWYTINGKSRSVGSLLCETFHGKKPRGKNVCVRYLRGPGSHRAADVEWGIR